MLQRIAAVMIMLSSTGLIGCSQTASPPNSNGFSVEQLMNALPTGVLGQRLGTKIVIEGVKPPPMMMSNPLMVDRVDGKILAKPFPIEIVETDAIQPGVRYKLEGFERGGYGGYPGWVEGAQGILQFRSEFVARRVLEPAGGGPVNVQKLEDQLPVGFLGKRLGAKIVIEGRSADVMMANPIEIDRVNGEALDSLKTMSLRGMEQLKPGIRYKLEGYESGEFSGPPDWAGMAQVNFQYRSFFVVVRVLEAVER